LASSGTSHNCKSKENHKIQYFLI